MQESYYAREPVDLKLLVLRLVRQAGWILGVTVLGMLIFGGGYYLKKVVLPAKLYAAESLYQVEYEAAPEDVPSVYINNATWDTWMGTKEFLDLVYEELAESEDAKIDRETMKTYLSADLKSNLMMPNTVVTTKDPALSLRLAAAVERAMQRFPSLQEGLIKRVDVVDPAGKATLVNDARPINALILSGIVTFFLTLVIISIRELGDDSIRLPKYLESRYGFKTPGSIQSFGFAENMRYLLRDCKRIGVLAAWGQPSEAAGDAVKKACDGLEVICISDIRSCPREAGKLRELDGLVIVAESGRGAGKHLEEVMEYLKVQDCPVKAAFLQDADETLLGWYYWRPWKKK